MAEKKAATTADLTKQATGREAAPEPEPTPAQRGETGDVERREFSDEERPSDSAPLATTRPKGQAPGPDVSHADVDLQSLSLDAADSTYHENPDPNPDELRPAPGPSTVQVLGTPSED
jgi:hypothetical protein